MSDKNTDDSPDDAEDGFEWQRSESSDGSDGPSSTSTDQWNRNKFEHRESYTKATRDANAEPVPDESQSTELSAGDETEADASSSTSDPEVTELKETIERLQAENKSLSNTVENLEETIDSLESENGKLRKALSKTKTEFQEYKSRTQKRVDQAEQAAIADVVEDMADVRDTLNRALEQGEGADIRDGVQSTLTNFDRVMQDRGIELIDPELGTEPDAQRHEVMMKDTSDDVPEGTIQTVFGVGYQRDGNVLQPAKVIVSSGPETTDS